jgi:hypothetical protein
MAVTVLAPFTTGPAIELGNQLWRKRVLPAGDVLYEGKTLHFTPDYLRTLASSFSAKAYDAVSFQLADARNSHTNDPERHRGTVVGMSAEPDGLWLTLKPTEAGHKVLTENPNLGISARIVEQYQRSDGKSFPAAIQHVLGTLDPRIPGLGAWQPVEMANAPQAVIDLSGQPWVGEPALADDGELTQAEWEAMVAALTDEEISELFADLDLESPVMEGDQTAVTPQPEFAQLSATFNGMQALELARQQQDAAPLPRRDEDKLAVALSRVGSGTYVPAAEFSNAAPAGFGLCGPADDFGRCSAAYHALTCPILPTLASPARPTPRPWPIWALESSWPIRPLACST